MQNSSRTPNVERPPASPAMDLVKPQNLLLSLASDVCPMCGEKKQHKHTLCGGCFSQLPPEMGRALYKRLGSGYAEAVRDAMLHLKCTIFRLLPRKHATALTSNAER
jgi:predicted amidophosphoribosyltransferase